ncbi:MAG: hypothetical protein HYV02_08835 [Deltaproteobacteria bacterium]|nr:hypothetical protein [Deltaproteobacteria bacterium]
MKKTLLLMSMILFLLPTLPACGGRQPSMHRAERLVTGYFKRYGRRYDASTFGEHPVTKTRVREIEELHKHYVHLLAELDMEDGGTEIVRAALEKKAPLGWRLVAWERLSPEGFTDAPAMDAPPASSRHSRP